MASFPCWLLRSLPLPELEAVATAVVTAVVEAAVVESVLSPEQTIVQRTYYSSKLHEFYFTEL